MAQPPPTRVSLRGILSFPYRLCNPPPAVGRVRSCAVTPVLDVRLDDVLARRHLPPIGLKDLEEYLLYVEHAPENLYFILWLKDYTTRYQAWVQREKSSLVVPSDPRSRRHKFSAPPTPDPALAMFYLRAKQTFFTPNGQYELNIPSDVLAPFHASPHAHALHLDQPRPSLWHSQSVHPDPAVFTEVAIEARYMLSESLRRFVRAAYTNVGSRRAICGIVAGCLITLLAGFLPLLLTTGRWNIGPHQRLIRLVAFPGLWFGLTVLLASLQGICLMVYIFGDVRQLRKFELARPTISRPLPMPISPPLDGSAHRSAPYSPSRIPPLSEKSGSAVSHALGFLDSPTFVSPTHRYTSSPSIIRTPTPCKSCDSDACSSEECNEIDISPAFFDDVPAPEGPATASCLHRPEFRMPTSITYIEPAHLRSDGRSPKLSSSTPTSGNLPAMESNQSTRGSVRSPSEYGPTAGFIPNDYTGSAISLCDTARSMRSQRSACYFNFDMLPSNPVGRTTADDGGGPPPAVSAVPPFPSDPLSVPPAVPFLGRAQYKCNQRASLPFEKGLSSVSSKDRSRRKFSLTTLIPSFTAGVPAFAAPLTQIQSPVVKRAQWEVVTRAGLVAMIIAGVVTGVVVGVVP